MKKHIHFTRKIFLDKKEHSNVNERTVVVADVILLVLLMILCILVLVFVIDNLSADQKLLPPWGNGSVKTMLFN